MRARVMDTVLILAARNAFVRPTIEEVLAESGVSRGTFYKYFDSVPDLMNAVGAAVAHELSCVLDPLVTQMSDPAARLSGGLRISLRLVGRHPPLGNLLVQSGWPNVDKSHPVYAALTRDIESGIRQGRFSKLSLPVALNMVAGCMVGGIHSMGIGASKSYPDEAAFCMLRGLGVESGEAQTISKMRLANPRIPDSGIVARLLGAQTPDA
jgi:TetR/AcrR family transcriptional regulator, ethionamide resistance regulator